MTIIVYHKNFKKAFAGQPKSIQKKFILTIDVFANDQFHYSLNNHALGGEFAGWRSFNITGNVRVHYEVAGDNIVLVDIGTDSQLYG